MIARTSRGTLREEQLEQGAQRRMDAGMVAETWRDDVALEMWVDVSPVATVVRLEGVLDDATGPSLMNVVKQCQSEGGSRIVLDLRALRITRSGWTMLSRLRRTILAAGGYLTWDRRAAVSHRSGRRPGPRCADLRP